MSRIINKEKSELKISYTIEGEEWAQAIEKAKVQLRKNVQIKGFRKGKVPAREADKHLVFSEVIDKALRLSVDKIYEEKILTQITKEDEIIGQPQFNIAELGPEKATLEAIYPLFPEIKLGDYKKLGIKLGDTTVSEKEVKTVKNNMVQSLVVMEETDKAIEMGDEVNFDFKGFIDGKPFDGGDAEDFDLVIGSNQFIPGFEAQMVGLKKGDEKDLNLTFPQEYHAKHLAGKAVVFNVKINSVKHPSYPEINEEFIKQGSVPNVSSVAEFNKYAEIQALRAKLTDVQNEFVEKATKKLVETSTITVPDSLLLEEAKKYYNNFLNNLKQQQITEKEYMEFSKTTKEDVLNTFKEQAKPNLQKVFLFGAIAKAEGFKVTDEQYEAECQKLADIYGLKMDQVKQILKFQNVEMNLMNKWIQEKLMQDNDAKGYKVFAEKLAEVDKFEKEQTEKIVAESKRKLEAQKKLDETSKKEEK